MDNIVGGRCSVSLITQLRKCIFSKNKIVFRHLKLEIALAIPASNDEKYNSNNSAEQGLNDALNIFYMWWYAGLTQNFRKQKFSLNYLDQNGNFIT